MLGFIQHSFQMNSTNLYLLSTFIPSILQEFRYYGGEYPTWDFCHLPLLYLFTFQFQLNWTRAKIMLLFLKEDWV